MLPPRHNLSSILGYPTNTRGLIRIFIHLTSYLSLSRTLFLHDLIDSIRYCFGGCLSEQDTDIGFGSIRNPPFRLYKHVNKCSHALSQFMPVTMQFFIPLPFKINSLFKLQIKKKEGSYHENNYN